MGSSERGGNVAKGAVRGSVMCLSMLGRSCGVALSRRERREG